MKNISQSIRKFTFPTSIEVGDGVVKELCKTLQDQNCNSPLIVTDQTVAKLSFIETIKNDLTVANLKPNIYCNFAGNPIENHVNNGVTAYKSHKADSIIAIGGGAAIDVAKAIALMVNHPGSVFDYEDGNPNSLIVNQEVPFVIAVPTTAGTGSEVGRSSVISENKSRQKKIIFDPKMLPQHVLLDPQLSIYLPPQVTATTGIDAFTHLIEAFLVDDYSPLCDGIALQGIKLIHENLIRAFDFSKKPKANKEQLDVRQNMLVASLMGATAFQKGLGVNHSCAHALSTVCDLHHGLANALMLRHTMEFNGKICQDKHSEIMNFIGVNQDFVSYIREMLKQLDLLKNLSAYDVTVEHLKPLCDVAILDVCHQSNPRKVSYEDFEDLFKIAL